MIEQYNKQIFVFFNDFAHNYYWFDVIVVLLAEYLPFVFIATLLYLWFSRKINLRNNVLYAGYTCILGLGINFFITLLYFHSRPFVDKLGNVLINHTADSSFPSDHTTFMLSIAITLLVLRETRGVGLLLFAFGIIGGISRIISGIHYPLDILGAVTVSLISCFVIVFFRKKLLYVNKFVENIYLRFAGK